jgi:hypothetical protein
MASACVSVIDTASSPDGAGIADPIVDAGKKVMRGQTIRIRVWMALVLREVSMKALVMRETRTS